jgi:hypothetical protein
VSKIRTTVQHNFSRIKALDKNLANFSKITFSDLQFSLLQRLLKGKPITLLTDTESDMAELLRFYQQQNWDFLCRTAPNYLFGTSFQRVDSLKRLGKVCWNSNTSFLSGRIQEVTMAA